MDRPSRVALHLSCVLFAVVGSLLATVLSGGSSGIPVAAASGTAQFYGVNGAYLSAAIQHIWPQVNGAYCGIETAEALVNYDDEVHGAGLRFTSTANQRQVAAANQTSGASEWGHAVPTNPYGGITNIAPDFGTDPRSIAYDAFNYSLNNVFFHDYIYRWQFANGSQPSFYTQVQQATTNLGRAMETEHEPLSVTINAGAHSVIVSGIYSYTNPNTSYPAQISAVVYRDPMASPAYSRFEVSFSTWERGNFATPYGIYSLWSKYYSAPSDPEPSIGIYRPTSSHPVHWYHGFTWIQRDNNYANGSWNPDYSFTSTGSRMSTP